LETDNSHFALVEALKKHLNRRDHFEYACGVNSAEFFQETRTEDKDGK